MTDKVIKELPDIFIDNICTMKKASTDSTNKETMTESLIKVINFDKIPNIYAKGRGWKAVPKSNDALYKDINGNGISLSLRMAVLNRMICIEKYMIV